jgi:uncharacterized alkaline shock family protein YloU
MTSTRWNTLPCGRHPEHLLQLVADSARIHPRAHEATCPYCQAALAELGELWHPVREWATEDVELPRALLAGIITRVRKLVQSPRHVAVTTTKGVTTVTSWVLGMIAAAATQDTPGITGITGITSAVTLPRSDHNRRRAVRYGVDIAEVDAAAIGVTVGITAVPAPRLNDLADNVRRNIITGINNSTNIQVDHVDIRIDDIDLPS